MVTKTPAKTPATRTRRSTAATATETPVDAAAPAKRAPAKRAPAKRVAKAPAKRASARRVATAPAAPVAGAPAKRLAVPAPVPHFTRNERVARGRAERVEVPRSSHAAFEPITFRRDPVEVMSEQDSTRVPELVPIKYGRRLVSAFTFFRGAAALMAMDLSGTPRTGLHTQLCGGSR